MHYGPIYLVEMILIRPLKWPPSLPLTYRTSPRNFPKKKYNQTPSSDRRRFGFCGVPRFPTHFLNKISKCGALLSSPPSTMYEGKKVGGTSFPALEDGDGDGRRREWRRRFS